MKSLLKQNGFSLIEIVVALGVSIVLVLVMSASITMMHSGARSVEMSSKQLELMDDIRVTLGSPTACTSALAGQVFDPTAPLSINTFTTNVSGSAKTYTVGGDIAPGMKLKSFKILNNAAVPVVTVPMTVAGVTANYSRRMATAMIEVERAVGVQVPAMKIPITIMTPPGTGATTIASCAGAEEMSAAICQTLGLVPFVDPALPTGYRCLPKNTCRKGGVYSAGGAGGAGGFINPMTGGYSCPTGYTNKRIGTVNQVIDCGKKCIKKVNYPTYECLACLDADGNQLTMIADNANSTEDLVDLSEEADEVDAALGSQQGGIGNIEATAAATPPPATCLPPGTQVIPAPPLAASCSSGNPITAENINVCCSTKATVCEITTLVPDAVIDGETVAVTNAESMFCL